MNEGGLNFIPRMGRKPLLDGYQALLYRLFEPEPYYRRVLTFLSQYLPNSHLSSRPLTRRDLQGVLHLIWDLGLRDTGRRAFWSFLGRLLWRHPQCFPLGITIAAAGFHYRIMTHRFCAAPYEPAPETPPGDALSPRHQEALASAPTPGR